MAYCSHRNGGAVAAGLGEPAMTKAQARKLLNTTSTVQDIRGHKITATWNRIENKTLYGTYTWEGKEREGAFHYLDLEPAT